MPWTLRDVMSEATTLANLTDTQIMPSRVSHYVNLAIRDVANRLPAVEFERYAVSSTSSGSPFYFLPADCERLLNLSLTTGVTGEGGQGIRQTNVWEVDAQSNGTQTGIPTMFVSYGTWLEFYPSPNSSYSLQLRYQARFSEITNTESVPSVDTRYHSAVFFKTTEYLGLRSGNVALANLMHDRYEAELTKQPSALNQRQQDKLGMSARLIFKED
jgi:hypothetical protein